MIHNQFDFAPLASPWWSGSQSFYKSLITVARCSHSTAVKSETFHFRDPSAETDACTIIQVLTAFLSVVAVGTAILAGSIASTITSLSWLPSTGTSHD